MPQLLIRNLDPETIKRLKNRAKEHDRSLQGEVKSILEEAASLSMTEALARIGRIRKRFVGRTFSDSAVLIREDRER